MEMKIIDFFPMEKNDQKGIVTGTLKVELPESGILIAGISVFKKKENFHFTLPSRGDGTDPDTGKAVRYLTFAFLEKEKNNQLVRAIQKEAPIFIEQRLADKENPLIFPQKQQNKKNQPKTPEALSKPIEPKKTVSIEKPKIKPSIAGKGWMDPPPLTMRPTARYLSKFQK
jgi:hypothetical protein